MNTRKSNSISPTKKLLEVPPGLSKPPRRKPPANAEGCEKWATAFI
jgi:hypothetical protein